MSDATDPKPAKPPHYTDKKTWWAIILVAFLAGLGGGFAKSGWALAQDLWLQIFPRTWTINHLVIGPDNRAVSDVSIQLFEDNGEDLIVETRTSNRGTAKLTPKLKSGVYLLVYRVEHEAAVYGNTEQLALVADEPVPRTLVFAPENWAKEQSEVETPTLRPTLEPELQIARFGQMRFDQATWLSDAYDEVGVSESDEAGRARIVQYWRAAGYELGPDDGWASAFPEWVLQQSGILGAQSASARGWLKWGEPLTELKPGCIAVFWRGSPTGATGHVGFFVGTTADNRLLVLGGNQSNSVSVSKIGQERLLGCRWPA